MKPPPFGVPRPLWVELDNIEQWFEDEASRLEAGQPLRLEGLVNVIHNEFSQHLSPSSKIMCTIMDLDFKLQG